jgi:threonine dehydrogenase-like Zn-dependent dehydrogenase
MAALDDLGHTRLTGLTITSPAAHMKALTVRPGTAKSVEMIDQAPPKPVTGAIRVKGRAVGICGTDLEIIDGVYGEAPPGEQRLVLGHESLGEVLEAPAGSGFVPGDLVVGVVRRPDPELCDHCAVGEWDMCRSDHFAECGIMRQDGYAREEYWLEPQFAVRVDPSLRELGVLLEPASVIAKACMLSLHFLNRTAVPPRTALITGAGPIGLLAALAVRQFGLDTYVVDIVDSGPKPNLVRELGAHYHAGSARDLDISPDVVIECTGIGSVLRESAVKAAPGGVIALTGISSVEAMQEVDVSLFNKRMVLNNTVLFGSVNAGRTHYERAAKVLENADLAWLGRLISRRVPAAHWQEAMEREPGDVKVILDFG